jgi:hypothetical protein
MSTHAKARRPRCTQGPHNQYPGFPKADTIACPRCNTAQIAHTEGKDIR